MRSRSIVLGAAFLAGLGAGLLAQQPAAVPHEDISGIWNRLDTAGAGNWGALAKTFPYAKLRPEFAAKLPPEPWDGVGPPPADFATLQCGGAGLCGAAYDIRTQGPEVPYCAPIGGGPGPGGRGAAPAAAAAGGRAGTPVAGGPVAGAARGRGGNGPIFPNSGGISIMASNDSVVFVNDGAQGVARRVPLDGRKFQDPSRAPGTQSYGYWENGVLTIKSKGFGSGQTQWGRGWTEPTTEMTETLKLEPGGNRLVWLYRYEDPNVYLEPHTVTFTYERLNPNQYIFENFCDSKAWLDDQAKQAAARAGGAGAAGRGAAPAAGR